MNTTFGAACTLSVIAVAGTVVAGSAQLASAQQAQLAADMAALSAAMEYQSGNGSPCQIAAAIAQSNNADLTHCTLLGEDLAVRVSVDGIGAVLGARTAEATAGPVDEGTSS